MDALLGPPGSAARRRRRLALAAALGLATVVAWRASRKDSLARQKVRAVIAALRGYADGAVQWSAACATMGVLQGGEAWLRRHPELSAGSDSRQQLHVRCLDEPALAAHAFLLLTAYVRQARAVPMA